MRFDDLPENWTRLPLDDGPLAAGVIDLVIGSTDRRRNSLLLLPCDECDVGAPTKPSRVLHLMHRRHD